MTARPLSIGNGVLFATSEDFLNGYQAGHLAYIAQKCAAPSSDEELSALFLEKLESMETSSLYAVGFIVGWLNTLASKGTNLSPRRVSVNVAVSVDENTPGERG
ncbi:MAG TPA: hypothetical protein VFV38_14720 [Ktedonobacteraceae bacterium]|nr:hypothetical protein [Ktedonobacteraceae bacterium]